MIDRRLPHVLKFEELPLKWTVQRCRRQSYRMPRRNFASKSRSRGLPLILDVYCQEIWNTAEYHLTIRFHFWPTKGVRTKIKWYLWQKSLDLCNCDSSSKKIGLIRVATCSGSRSRSNFWSSASDDRHIINPLAESVDNDLQKHKS